MKPLTLILARATDGTIGDKGSIPWKIQADLARFKALTMGHAVIMGRRTWQSLPEPVRPLPGRRNIVVSTTMLHDQAPGASLWRSLEMALVWTRFARDEPFVIGGVQLYREALPIATRIYLTEVHASPAGDTRLELDLTGWTEVARQAYLNQAGGPNYSFVELRRAS